jgi:superfamily II DNA or RNA helicase
LFLDCGLGKTLIFLEFAQYAQRELRHDNKGVLIVSPLMVVKQTMAEAARFYPDMTIDELRAHDLSDWVTKCGGRIGITNYESIREGIGRGQLGAIILDESSSLKNFSAKHAVRIIEMGRGCEYKLCATGTPAPNDRIEYANHAVFLDVFPTVNSFLATYFVNRGQTSERWVLKSHALGAFYRSLSHWCIFMTNPATYGWKDNCENIPPIHVHIDEVPMTEDQRRTIQRQMQLLFATDAGGITRRSAFGQISKGHYKGRKIETRKYTFIKGLVQSWPDESTIIWCLYNKEQDELEKTFPDAASIRGETKHDVRQVLIDDFKSGRRRIMISKPKVLGFGLNLQIATRQVFSGLADSYESYYQAIKRSNRYGSTRPLNVHIPVTDLEEPMVANVLRKAKMIQQDTEEQERIFKEYRIE